MGTPQDPVQQRGATFRLEGEDYTLANALRAVLNRNPQVEFCGYSAPHPSDNCINLRIQTIGAITPEQALKQAAIEVRKVCEHIKVQFQQEIEKSRCP